MLLDRLIARLPYPTSVAQRAVAIAAIFTQAGIGVTGSIVRVTGSGLGCPTWPQCHDGTMFPVEHPEFDTLNQWIEFSNRLLTGLVGIVALLCLVAALRVKQEHPQRSRLVLLAAAMPAGVAVQAIVGGITVRTGLLWWTVAVHFLLSSVLVWLAVLLLHAFTEGDESPRWLIGQAGRSVLVLLVVVLGALLAAGTVVTGAGPHGGDPDTARLNAPIETLAQVHGGLLVLYLLVLAVLGFSVLRDGAPTGFVRRYVVLWLVTLGQGTLGSVQYALGVPEMLVSLHVLGSSLVVISTAALWCAARDRGPAPPEPDHPDTAASGAVLGTGVNHAG